MIFEPRRWFDIVGAAAYLSVKPRCIRELILRGKLRPSKIGRKYILDRLDLDALAIGEKRMPLTDFPQVFTLK
jgi:excisionase family DNA binding protein